MAKNFFKRYIWLVDLINRRKYVSFKEISEAWMRSPLNETGDPLSERTFFNHKDAIAGMFGIEILNDRSLGFYIGRSDVGSDETSDWMLHTLCLNNVLHENADMKDRILMEKVPSSERFLTDIISAMRDFRVISLCYQGFRHPEPFCFNVRPYCVKYFKQRWYLLGDSDLGLRIYSLDRFVDMEELEEHFEIPKGREDTCRAGPGKVFPDAASAWVSEGDGAGGRKFGFQLPHRPDLRLRAGNPLAWNGCGGARTGRVTRKCR